MDMILWEFFILSDTDFAVHEDIALQAVRQAGQLLLGRAGQFATREKAPRDLVTDVDLAAQELIARVIKSAFPDHAFLGEEDAGTAAGSSTTESWIAAQENCWIVDPIDGTTNYVHQLPFYSISIAFWQQGIPRLGVILDPVRDELFSATAGKGVLLNGEPVTASTTEKLSEALVAVSFAANIDDESWEVRRFARALHHCRAVRRIGSAALNLCYLASGRLDAYWASSVQPWDVAAGILFVREAGGLVTSLDGGEFQIDRPDMLAGATSPLHESLLELFAGV